MRLGSCVGLSKAWNWGWDGDGARQCDNDIRKHYSAVDENNFMVSTVEGSVVHGWVLAEASCLLTENPRRREGLLEENLKLVFIW